MVGGNAGVRCTASTNRDERIQSRGKARRILLLAGMLLFLLGICAAAESIDSKIDEVQLEQVKSSMPDLKLYYYPATDTTTDINEISTTLDGQTLTGMAAVPASQDEQGVRYYILLDISASIGDGYFEQIKEAILQAQAMMTEKDEMTLVTFGNEVNVVFENAKNTDDVTDTVQNLANDDMTTLMLEALKKTADLADQEQYALNRTIFLMITDGEDFSKEATRTEALTTLQKKNIPLYALTVRQTAGGAENEYSGEMGEFARETGGEATVFEESGAVTAMQEMIGNIQSAWMLQLRAASNQVGSGAETLSVIFGDAGEVHTITVYPVYYQQDQTAPEATVERLSEKELKITYSESVQGADQASHFQVVCDGTRLTPVQVNYVEQAGVCYTILVFSKDLESGAYEVSFTNITDSSMEKNTLVQTATAQLDDSVPETADSETNTGSDTDTEDGSAGESEDSEDENDWILIGVIAAAAVLVMVFAAIFLIRRKKRRQRELEEEASRREPEAYTMPVPGVARAYREPQNIKTRSENLRTGMKSPEGGEERRRTGMNAPDIEGENPGAGLENHAEICAPRPKVHVALREVESGADLILEIDSVTGEKPIRIKMGERLVVGRSSQCDVYLDDKRMSKQHFAVEREGTAYYISDLQSTNGTLVNGVKIMGRRRLKNGDDVQAGTVQMKIRW